MGGKARVCWTCSSLCFKHWYWCNEGLPQSIPIFPGNILLENFPKYASQLGCKTSLPHVNITEIGRENSMPLKNIYMNIKLMMMIITIAIIKALFDSVFLLTKFFLKKKRNIYVG